MSSFPSGERIIPIEVLGSPLSSPANAQSLADRLGDLTSSLNRSDPILRASRVSRGRSSQRSSVNSDGGGSKRASLIITHSDGSVEENAGFVTSLGMSDVAMDRSIDIQEIGQDTLLREIEQNKLRVVIPEASDVIVEELVEGSDFSETSSNAAEDVSESSERTTVVVEKNRSSNPISLTISGSSWSPTISSVESSPPASPTVKSVPIPIQKIRQPSTSPSPKTPRPTFKPPPPPASPAFIQPFSHSRDSVVDHSTPLSVDASRSSWSPTISSPDESPKASPATQPLRDSKIPPESDPTPTQSLSPRDESENYERREYSTERTATLSSVNCSVPERPVRQENTSYVPVTQDDYTSSADCAPVKAHDNGSNADSGAPVVTQNTSHTEHNWTVEKSVKNDEGLLLGQEINLKGDKNLRDTSSDSSHVKAESRSRLENLLKPLIIQRDNKIGEAPISHEPIEIPIQREKKISVDNIKSSPVQLRRTEREDRRHSMPEKVSAPLLGRGTMPEQGTNRRSEEKGLLEPTGEGKSQPVRIVPISFPDDDETQEIRVEFNEMNSRRAAEEDNGGGKAGEGSKGGRVIPIQLASGQTVMPTFTKLEETEPPVWSVFRTTGNEKERVVPIQRDGPPAQSSPGNITINKDDLMAKNAPENIPINKDVGKETAFKPPTGNIPVQRDEFGNVPVQKNGAGNVPISRDLPGKVSIQREEPKNVTIHKNEPGNVPIQRDGLKNVVIHSDERGNITNQRDGLGNVPIQRDELKNSPIQRDGTRLTPSPGTIPTQSDVSSAKPAPGNINPSQYQQTPVTATNAKDGQKASENTYTHSDDFAGSTATQARQLLDDSPTTRGRTRLTREEQAEVRSTLDRVHQELETAKDRLASQVAHLSRGSSPVTTATIPKVKKLSETDASQGTGNSDLGKPVSGPYSGITASPLANTSSRPNETPLQTGYNSGTSSFRPVGKPSENYSSSARSRSLDTKHRTPLPRNGARSGSCQMGRERSMEDINKDIETIWKELQELDSLPTSRTTSRNDLSSDKSQQRKWSQAPRPSSATPQPPRPSSATPLSEQRTPASWRTMTPPPYKDPPLPSSRQSTSPLPQSSRPLSPTARQSASPTTLGAIGKSTSPLPPLNANLGTSEKSETSRSRTTIWDLPPTSQSKLLKEHSSYASPNSKRPALFPATPVQDTSDPLMSTSWNNKPQYNPVTSGHFSFQNKTIPTKPGSITPAYVTTSPRLTTRSTARNTTLPNVKTRSASSNPGTSRVPIVETGLPFPGEESKTAGKSEGQLNLKSCLKTDSREPRTRFIRTRSESPAGRDSPSKLNVNFKPDTTFYITKDKPGGESTYATVNSSKVNGEKRGNLYNNTAKRNDGVSEDLRQVNAATPTLSGAREVPIQKESPSKASAINTNGLPTRNVPIQLEGRPVTPTSQSSGASQLSAKSLPSQQGKSINVPIQSEYKKSVPIQSENKIKQPEKNVNVPLEPEKRKDLSSVQPNNNKSVPIQLQKNKNMSMQTGKDTEIPIQKAMTLPKQDNRGKDQTLRSRTSSRESKQNNRISDPGPSSSASSGPPTTDEACFACDACTQTTDNQQKDKKGACIVM